MLRGRRLRDLIQRRGEDEVVDLVVALLLAGLGVAGLTGATTPDRPADLLGVALVLVGAGSLVLIRRAPLAVLGVTLATSLTIDQLGYAQNGLGLTVLWALYVVAVRLPRPLGLGATATSLVLVNISLVTGHDDASMADHVSSTVILGAGWAFGRAGQARRSRREAEERADHAEERTRVAREMQDLVAHELAELSVQLTAARRLIRRDARATEELLVGAESNARTAVAEARRILTLLSPPEAAAGPRGPLPSISDLDDLASTYRVRGLPVQMHLLVPDGVAPGPGLLTYRVVEVALEEAGRTGATVVEVSVAGDPGLHVSIRHDGRAAASGVAGGSAHEHTLVGLRRRAELYGGTVDRRVGPSGPTVVLEIPAAGARRAT